MRSAKRRPAITRNRSVQFGAPCIAGTRVTVEAVVSRFHAGDSVSSLALDFGLLRRQIEDAIRYDLRAARRAWRRKEK